MSDLEIYLFATFCIGLEEGIMSKVAVIMGSKSDWGVVSECVKTLKEFGVETYVKIISAHRTPDDAAQFSKNARENGFGAIICAAGKAAHLGGVIAAYTTLPVIGLPIKTDMCGGLDSLLSIVQMPSGIPVACVGINGAENAALLAIQILGVTDKDISSKLDDKKAQMKENIAKDNEALIEELNKL